VLLHVELPLGDVYVDHDCRGFDTDPIDLYVNRSPTSSNGVTSTIS
jgi:hypothetical protein